MSKTFKDYKYSPASSWLLYEEHPSLFKRERLA